MGEFGQVKSRKYLSPEMFKPISTICVIGLVVFFLMLFNAFVWDDIIQIVHNSNIASLKNIPKLFVTGQLGVFYRPVFYSTFAVLYSLFKLNPFFYHFFQLIIHIGNAVLIFLFLGRYFEKKLSLFLSLLFLIHPMNVESVVYVSAISDTLFVFFGLVALFLMSKEKESVYTALVAAFVILLSLLTKGAGFLFLVIILIYRILFKRKNLHLILIFSLVPIVLYSFLRFFVAHTFFAGVNFVPIAEASLFERLLTMPKIIFFYLSSFIAPVKLTIAHEWVIKSPTLVDFYIPLVIDFIAVIIFTLIGRYFYKTKKKVFLVYIFFILWFLVGLSFYLQIVPLDMTVADRWFYLPMIGLIGIVGLLIENILVKDKFKKYIPTVFMIVLLVFALRSVARTINWYDGYTLYVHDEKISKDNYLLKHNLAVELAKKGNNDEALKYEEESIKLNPDWGMTWGLTGTLYYFKKDFPKANYYLTESLKRDGGVYGSFYYLGCLNIYTKDYVSAENWIKQGLGSYSDNTQLIELLAIVKYLQGYQSEALDLIQKVTVLNPNPRSQSIFESIYNKQQLQLDLYLK